VLRDVKKVDKIFCQLLVNKRGERRNEKGDCEADEPTANKGETIRIGYLKTSKP
jgi:hypothetical protein